MTLEMGDRHQDSFHVPELGIDVILGNSSGRLRHDGPPKFYNMLIIGSPAVNAAIILNARKTWNGVCPNELKVTTKSLIRNENLPFLFTQVCLAGIRHGTNPKIDLEPFFVNRDSYRPSIEEIMKYNLTATDLYIASNKPAILTGSLLVEYWALEEREVLMRPRRSGPYSGKLVIVGGHMDRMDENPSFFEAMEEANIPTKLLRIAKPLGISDQVVLTENEGNYKLTHYLNMIWTINLTGRGSSAVPRQTEDAGWSMMDWDDFHEDQLTPIARSALTFAKFL